MAYNTDKKDLKVKPGSKESEHQRAKNLLKDHPEILFNARDLFHNKNGQTVIEAMVPRGDISVEDSVTPRTQYDVTNDDLQAISKYAKKIMDPVIKEYDVKVATEDALTRAIATLDDGKFDHKINANTYNLLMDNLVKQ